MEIQGNFNPISASRARDSLGVTRLLDYGKFLPLRQLGFKGDGAYHPLSETFTTLAAAQAVFPRAQSLSEQIDGHAIQRLIDDGVSSPAHAAIIDIPPGQFYLSRKLEVAGNAHLTLNGSGIKATTGVQLADDLFLLAGYGSPLLGTLEINDMQIAAGGGTSGARALDVNSLAVPSMLGSDVQFAGWKSVLLGNNITGSHLTKWRAYYGPGVESEANRTQDAFVFRQTRGCFLNVFEAFQTEGYRATCDYLNTSNPGYEGQYWNDLNTNSGTSVANIVSTVNGYDSPQWYFTGVELEVSGNWFNLVNVSGVTIEVDFALTFQASFGFSCFSLTGVAGAELVINQFKTFSFPGCIFYLNSGNAAVNMTLGALRVMGGKVGGLVYFGSSCSGCREYGMTGVFAWDYSVPFASGPTMRTNGNISVHDVKYRANVAGFFATVEARGPANVVTLVGTYAGNTANSSGDITVALPDKVFASNPIVLVTNGDANTPMEPLGVLSASPTSLTVRCQGATQGSARRINFIGYGN